MDSSKILVLLALLITCLSIQSASANLKLFREYIGADDKGVKLSDIPMNSEVEVHFILSFAIDYTNSSFSPSPTDGNFKVYWDTENLSPSQVSSIKARHPNVKVVISLGGDTIANNKKVYFQPTSVKSWVRNAINSITEIVKEYDLDGIDIDYENFHVDADADIFAECIGQLLLHLKQNRVISFASIAPFDDSNVQLHYSTLWKKYSHLIDYVNFQFYAYDKGTTVPQFMEYFETQNSNYKGGKVLVSLGTDGSGGLSPEKGFFDACNRLKQMNKLYGIFIWSADDSKKAGFPYEKESLNLLASMN